MIQIKRYNLPESIDGAVTQLKDGNFLIILNKTKSPLRQMLTIAHELWHVANDFDEIKDVQAMEKNNPF